MTNAGRDRSIPNGGYGFFTMGDSMGEIADDIVGDMYERDDMGWEGFDEDYDPAPGPHNVEMEITVMRETDKAVLARTEEHGDVWMPKSKVAFNPKRTVASVPGWLEARWREERRGGMSTAPCIVPPGRRKSKVADPRPMTIVTWKDDIPGGMREKYESLYGERFLFFGEILNMPGHGTFINIDTNKTIVGLHVDSFRETTEDET